MRLLSLGAVVVVMGAAATCVDDTINLCEPSQWSSGVSPPDMCGCGPGLVCGGPTVGPDVRDKYGQGPVCPDPYTCIPDDDGGDAGSPIGSCAAQCQPVPPFGWSNPGLVWIGAQLQAPACPNNAPEEGPDGYADLIAPNVCGACQCDLPAGSCGQPSTLTASSTACPGAAPGAVHTPFDPPDGGWDGGCTANDAVAGGQLCDGGPCVQSLTIAPLVVNESGCTPTQAPMTQDPPSWGTFARLCRGEPVGGCGSDGLVCSPLSAPGFSVCIYQKEDNDCPGTPYTEKYVFYTSYQDTRTCSPCSCGLPVGSVCSAEVSIYADDLCGSVASYMVAVDSTKAVCHDLITGAALGSKSATPPSYTPGTCQPTGGEPMGSVDPVGPFTLCCIPPL